MNFIDKVSKDYKLSKPINLGRLYETNCLSIENKPGVYFITLPTNEILINDFTTAITKHKNKNLIYSIDKLKIKYENSDGNLVYIGKASHNLSERTDRLVKYGKKEVKNHRGGRAIWQINAPFILNFQYLLCEDPDSLESNLLIDYKKNYGVYPLANFRS